MRGSVVKRGKTFSIVYDLGKDTNGKRLQKWESGFATKRLAEKTLRMRIDDIENSYANKLERSTVEVFLRQWLKDYCEVRLAQNTINGYMVNIENHIIPCIGNIQLHKLEPIQVQTMYAKLRKDGLSETSILYVHAVLRKALNYAVKQRVLSYNVTNHVEAPRKSVYKPTVLNSEDICKLLTACEDSEIYMPVLLAVTLGLRRGEALGLMWNDIDFDNRTLEVKRTATFTKKQFILSNPKTKNSNRTIMLSPSIYDKLKEHQARQALQALEFGEGFNPYSLVACRVDGSPLTSNVLQNQFKRIIQEIDIANIRFHDLRHTNATLMLKQNIPAKIVSSMLGHSSVGITLDIYSHVLTDMQEPAVTVIEKLLNKKVR